MADMSRLKIERDAALVRIERGETLIFRHLFLKTDLGWFDIWKYRRISMVKQNHTEGEIKYFIKSYFDLKVLMDFIIPYTTIPSEFDVWRNKKPKKEKPLSKKYELRENLKKQFEKLDIFIDYLPKLLVPSKDRTEEEIEKLGDEQTEHIKELYWSDFKCRLKRAYFRKIDEDYLNVVGLIKALNSSYADEVVIEDYLIYEEDFKQFIIDEFFKLPEEERIKPQPLFIKQRKPKKKKVKEVKTDSVPVITKQDPVYIKKDYVRVYKGYFNMTKFKATTSSRKYANRRDVENFLGVITPTAEAQFIISTKQYLLLPDERPAPEIIEKKKSRVIKNIKPHAKRLKDYRTRLLLRKRRKAELEAFHCRRFESILDKIVPLSKTDKYNLEELIDNREQHLYKLAREGGKINHGIFKNIYGHGYLDVVKAAAMHNNNLLASMAKDLSQFIIPYDEFEQLIKSHKEVQLKFNFSYAETTNKKEKVA